VAKGRTALIGFGLLLVFLGLLATGERLAASRPLVSSPTPKVAGAWTEAIQRVDEAVATADLAGAERAWRDAYGEALRSRRWDAMIDVGDASVRIGASGPSGQVAISRARQSYRAALFRARQAGSAEGVRLAGEAFERLGDRAVAAQAARIAAGLEPRPGVAGTEAVEPGLEPRILGDDTVRAE